MTTTIAITTFKGGVGKTTTARDLSAALARRRCKVLALDLDRTQRHLMKFDEYFEGLADVELRAATAGRIPRLIERAEKAGYDFVILDCPPALEKQTVAALKFSDLVIAPAQPEYLAADGLARVQAAVEAARIVNRNLQMKVLITMTDSRDPSCAIVERAIRRNFNGRTFPDSIKRQGAINQAALAGASVFASHPRCQAARVYSDLAGWLIEQSKNEQAKEEAARG